MSQENDDDRTIIRPGASASGAAGAGNPAPASPPPSVTTMPGSGLTSFPAATARPAAPSELASSANEYHNALPLGTYLGEFEVQGVIGEGGFGIVYLAWDHSLERRVALKEYMPSALASRSNGNTVSVKSERHRETFQAGLSSFVNEARLLAQFDHASLVKVYRFWEANGTAYMIMPFYEGVTLKDTLKALGQAPDEGWLLGMLGPLTEALEVIHAEQCFHRDIAPDNVILLKGSQRPLLLDFGAARRVIGDMTQALTVILKPGYAPVEQYAEVPGMKQGPWTDVYALAALVYNAITGKTPPTSVGRLMNDNYQPLAEVAKGRYSERFLQGIDQALKVKPEERTPNIAALRAEIGLDQMSPGTSARTVMPGLSTPAAGTGAGGGHQANKPASGKAASVSKAADGGGGGNKTAMYAGVGLGVLALAGAGAWFVLGGKPAASNAVALQSGAAGVAPVASSPAPAAVPSAPAVVATTAPVVAANALAPKLDGPFEPIDEFRRIVAMADPAFKVDAQPAKPQFRIGKDRLSFKVTSAKEGYVYVMIQSTDGAFMRLFPNTIGKDNHINAGQTLSLPQAGWPMDTAGPAGTDQFLVVISEHPRDFVHAEMKMDGGFGEFPTKDAALAVLRKFPTGASPFVGRPQCPQGDACPDVYGATTFSSEEIE